METNFDKPLNQDVTENSQDIAKVQNGLAYIVGDTNTTGETLAVGQFVYVKGHSTIDDGLRAVTASISADGNITTSNTSACSDGGLNALNSNIVLIRSKTTGSQSVASKGTTVYTSADGNFGPDTIPGYTVISAFAFTNHDLITLGINRVNSSGDRWNITAYNNHSASQDCTITITYVYAKT